MKNNKQITQTAVQSKKPKVAVLGKASTLTLGPQGGGLEGNNRPKRGW